MSYIYELLKFEDFVAVRMKNYCDVSILRAMTTDKKAHAFLSLTLSGFKFEPYIFVRNHIFSQPYIY